MYPPEKAELNVPPHKDPRDAYISHIFHPGRFSNHAILRALHVSILGSLSNTITLNIIFEMVIYLCHSIHCQRLSTPNIYIYVYINPILL